MSPKLVAASTGLLKSSGPKSSKYFFSIASNTATGTLDGIMEPASFSLTYQIFNKFVCSVSLLQPFLVFLEDRLDAGIQHQMIIRHKLQLLMPYFIGSNPTFELRDNFILIFQYSTDKRKTRRTMETKAVTRFIDAKTSLRP